MYALTRLKLPHDAEVGLSPLAPPELERALRLSEAPKLERLAGFASGQAKDGMLALRSKLAIAEHARDPDRIHAPGKREKEPGHLAAHDIPRRVRAGWRGVTELADPSRWLDRDDFVDIGDIDIE